MEQPGEGHGHGVVRRMVPWSIKLLVFLYFGVFLARLGTFLLGPKTIDRWIGLGASAVLLLLMFWLWHYYSKFDQR